MPTTAAVESNRMGGVHCWRIGLKAFSSARTIDSYLLISNSPVYWFQALKTLLAATISLTLTVDGPPLQSP